MIAHRPRGEPLVVLIGVLALWVLLRIGFWAPIGMDAVARAAPAAVQPGPGGDGWVRMAAGVRPGAAKLAGGHGPTPMALRAAGWRRPGGPAAGWFRAGWMRAGWEQGGAIRPDAKAHQAQMDAYWPAVRRAGAQPLAGRMVPGGRIAATAKRLRAHGPLGAPPEGLAGGDADGALSAVAAPGIGALALPAPRTQAEAAEPAEAPASTAVRRRWSGDGWMLVRRGSIAGDHGAILPAYGASQAGAILRYRLDPGGARPIEAYARVSAALVAALRAPARASDAALGLSVRPVATAPVTIAIEARISRFDDGRTHLRPAAMAIAAPAPQALPLGTTGEVYAAAGYVGGAAATGFVDGQARIDRALGRAGGFDLRAGVGAWGGAQRGAGRLDVGPTASVGVAIGAIAARVRIDWRFRVAGAAAPGSGPALTLAAGF